MIRLEKQGSVNFVSISVKKEICPLKNVNVGKSENVLGGAQLAGDAFW